MCQCFRPICELDSKLSLVDPPIREPDQSGAKEDAVDGEGGEAGAFEPSHQDDNGDQGGDEGHARAEQCL